MKNGTATTKESMMSKNQIHRIAGIMANFHMGKTGYTTKAQVIVRLAGVVGTKAEAARVYARIMR